MSRLILAVAVVHFASCGPGGGGQDSVTTPERMAVTVNAAFDHASGSYSIVDLDALTAVPDVLAISPDAVAVCAAGRIFVIQRLGWDSLLLVDEEAPFGIRGEHSCGNGSNPQGLVPLPSGDLLVTLLDRDYLIAIDPQTGDEVSRVDLSWAADGDGLPEASLVALAGDHVAVALQRLDRSTPLWDPSSQGWLVLLDSTTLDVVDTVVLTGANPSPYGRMIWDGERLLVPETGFYGELDGGLDGVALAAPSAAGFVVTEAGLGGDITDVILVDGTLAYATVTTLDGVDRLVRFDPSTGAVEPEPVLTGDGFTLLQMQLTSDGRLLVVDRDLHDPGIRVLEAATGAFIAHVHVGMAPFSVCTL